MPYFFSRGMSRRKAIQILGLAGGGISAVLLGRSLVSSNIRVEKLDNNTTLDLIPIPDGDYWMGSESSRYEEERNPHKVAVSSFLIGRYQVTQAQWKAIFGLEDSPSRWQGDNLPVENVSWNDAVEFCKRLSERRGREYRLPSEAEWEYACRAGTTTPFYFGANLTPDLANYQPTSPDGSISQSEFRAQTVEVGSFLANEFGLYDMHGNVLEWCLDYWHDSYQDAPSDGSAWIEGGDSSRRVVRGGAWRSQMDACRSAFRFSNEPSFKSDNTGFRIVCGSWE